MNTERLHLSPVEKELLFGLWCKKRDVRLFLVDLDDTLCPTREVFRKQMSQALMFLVENLHLTSPDGLKSDVEEINNHLFETMGVNPIRWKSVVSELAGRYPLTPAVQKQTEKIFAQIYTTPLEIFPGAENALKFLQKARMPIGIITHANTKWTWRKYSWLGLDRFLDWSDIFIVDENGHKTASSWRESTEYFHINPENCVAAGDSPRSDINPAKEIGIKHRFLIDNGNLWSVHNEPVDTETKIITDLAELMEIGRRELEGY